MHIITSGGGGFSQENNIALDEYILGVTRRHHSVVRPRIVFLPTASGDADHYILKFYRRFSSQADCAHISLFRRERNQPHFKKTIKNADLIYVGGGSVGACVGAWHETGISELIKEAYYDGTCLAGPSAGALCWFSEGLSYFYPWPTRYTGLGILPGSLEVHYQNEPLREKHYKEMIEDKRLPAGYGLSDKTALHWHDGQVVNKLTTDKNAKAYYVTKQGQEELELNLLEDPNPMLEVFEDHALEEFRQL